MNDYTLACGMYQLEHAAMCDNSSAAAVLAHIKRLQADRATMGGELLAKTSDCGYLEGENTRLQHEHNILFAGKAQVAQCYQDEQIKSQRLTADLAQLREMYADRDGDLAWEYGRANALEAEVERLQADNLGLETANAFLLDENKRLSSYLEEATTAAASGADPQDYLATKAPTTLRDENKRLTAENELYRHISVELQGENERLTDDGVQYEHVQPNGKPVLIAENERLTAENERLLAANERMSGAWLKHERLQPDGELWASLDEVLAENEWLRAKDEQLRDTIKRLTPAYTPVVNMAGGCPKQGWCDCPADDFEYDGDGAQAMANELAIVRSVYADCTHEHVMGRIS